jgi:hypothetical protein
MIEVNESNGIYSQILYCEFILMFVSLLSIINSVINWEFNFLNLCPKSDPNYSIWINFGDDSTSLIYIASMGFNTLCTIILCKIIISLT